MKPFTFRLSRILALRTRSERERARDLGLALGAEEVRREELRDAVARLRRFGEQAAGAVGGVTTAGALRTVGLSVRAVAEELESAAESHRVAEATLANEAERFGEARRERRVVERLRDRREAAWNQDASRHEQTEIDRLARRRPGMEDAR